MALQFTRDVQVAIKLGSDIWEVPVLDGFSFSQAINASEITVSESGATSRRGRLLFNDSLAPVEWSLSTYARPTSSGSKARCIEEALWAMYVGATTFDSDTGVFSGTASPATANTFGGTTTNTFNLTQSDVSAMSELFEIYFMFKPTGGTNQVYKITKAAVNSVTIDFDIDGIATIQWSGFGSELSDVGTNIVTPTITAGIDSTTNFIRNRISTVTLSRTDVSDTYNIVLTGGSINFENNISYLTPEELGQVNKPLGNITGTRSISGNLTCYLDNNISASKSGELFADLVADTTTVRNVFDLDINIGGAAAPALKFSLPTAHLEIPVVNVEDLLTLDIAFHGQASGGNIDSQNEATIVYTAA
jgi:hypothetical protein